MFGWPKRTAQRRKRVGWALEWHPELDDAVRNGLGLTAAGLLGTVIGEDATRWLRVARRVGRRELARAVEAQRQSLRSSDVLERYERSISDADAWVAEQPEDRAPPAGGPIRVALAWPKVPSAPFDPPAAQLAAPPVLTAARWWVEHVVLPKRTGFRRVAERDRYRCQNPECGRLTLRCECHHIVHRIQGGSDELENGVATCRPCHLRGLHTGRDGGTPNIDTEALEVAGRAALLWSYVAGRRVLQFR